MYSLFKHITQLAMKTLSVTVSDEGLANEDASSLPRVSEIDQLKSKLKTIKYFGEYRGRFNDLQKDVTKDAFVISETFLSDIQMTTIFEKHLFVAESLRTARGQWGIYTRKLIKQNTILGVYYGKIFTMSQKRENDRELSYPLAVGIRIQGNGHQKNKYVSPNNHSFFHYANEKAIQNNCALLDPLPLCTQYSHSPKIKLAVKKKNTWERPTYKICSHQKIDLYHINDYLEEIQTATDIVHKRKYTARRKKIHEILTKYPLIVSTQDIAPFSEILIPYGNEYDRDSYENSVNYII